VIRYELTSLNHKISTYPMRDYAEIFNAIVNSLQEPFTYKLIEIEEKCKEILKNNGYNEQQFRRLHEILIERNNEQIQPIIRQLEEILPIIREAATIARESVRVCAVFTAWSRELGDLIRTDGLNSEILMQYADELHIRFAERFLAKHWLPPSLTPLLRVSAIALRRRYEEKILQRSTCATNTDLTLLEMEKFEAELKTLRAFKAKQLSSFNSFILIFNNSSHYLRFSNILRYIDRRIDL
uniref:Dynein heavy chain tail domain-containing protein n=1 Tax=Parascaris univalens TaxID=6257 RepID=A0A915B5B4_PARUN